MKRYPDPVATYAVLSLVGVVAVLSRVFGLDQMAPFIDETMHILGAVRVDFFPLAVRAAHGGKIFGHLFFLPAATIADDPVVVARLTVALCGSITTVIAAMVALELTRSNMAALGAGLTWGLMPFIVFHDRIALVDPLVTLLLSLSILFALKAINKGKHLIAFFGGLLFGLAVITKVTALTCGATLLALAWAFGDDLTRQKRRLTASFILGTTGPVVLLVVLALTDLANFTNVLSSFLGADKIGEDIDYLARIMQNTSTLVDWITTYNGRLFIAAVALAIGMSLTGKPSDRRITLALLASFLIITVSYLVAFKVWFPRYYHPTLFSVALLVGVGTARAYDVIIESWKQNRWRKSGVVGAVMLLSLLSLFTSWGARNFALASSHETVAIPEVDRRQYFTGWASGYDVGRLCAFLRDEQGRTKSTIRVITGFGMWHGMMTFPLLLKDEPRIKFHPVMMYTKRLAYNALDILSAHPDDRFFVLNEFPRMPLPPDVLPLFTPPLATIYDSSIDNNVGYRLYELDHDSTLIKPVTESDGFRYSLYNLNGLEKWDGVDSFWMGQGETIIYLTGATAERLQIKAQFIPGPSVPGKNNFRLLLSANGKSREVTISAPSETVLEVPLRPGRNKVLLKPLDEPAVLKLPNGDKRPLILGVQNLLLSGSNTE